QYDCAAEHACGVTEEPAQTVLLIRRHRLESQRAEQGVALRGVPSPVVNATTAARSACTQAGRRYLDHCVVSSKPVHHLAKLEDLTRPDDVKFRYDILLRRSYPQVTDRFRLAQ